MKVIEILKELIAINSVNPFKTVIKDGTEIGIGNEEKITEYLESKLISRGFSVKRQTVQDAATVHNENNLIKIPSRYNLLASKGSGKKSLLFIGHMDTVDIKEGWETNPFEGVIKNENGKQTLYGLGANDMKAGLAAILAAIDAEEIKDYTLKVAFVCDEEFWSYGAVKLLESDFLDDVILAISPEVGDFNRKNSNQAIVLGRMGRTEYIFEITGVACHGAKARINKDAVNAVHESVKLQQHVIDYCKKNAKTFSHGELSITNSSYISQHHGGKAILSVPDKASFILDRSFVINENSESELEILKSLVEEAYEKNILDSRTVVSVKQRSRPTPICKPYFFPPEHKAVKFVTECVDSAASNHEYGIGYSVADENRLAERGITSIVVGPLGSRSHSPQEWVNVESIITLVQIYKKIIKNFRDYQKNNVPPHPKRGGFVKAL